MRAATEAERKQIDAAVSEVRRAYLVGTAKVTPLTSLAADDDTGRQVAGAWAALGLEIEKWATKFRAWAINGKRDNGTEYTVARFLEYGRTDLASAITYQSKVAYDASVFRVATDTIAATAEQVVDPLSWPTSLKVAVGVGVTVIALLAVSQLAGGVSAIRKVAS